MHDLILLTIIWASVFLASYSAHRTKLTPVLWFLFFGSLMVNLGILPQEMPMFIKDFAEIGIILIMFALGFEENSENFIRGVKKAWGIALFGALAPFATAYTTAYYFWQDSNLALMCGLAMTATAVSLTMVSLRSEKLHTSAASTGIMTSAVLDDIASLAMVAILVPMATGEATLSFSGIGMILFKAVMFFVIVTVLGAWLFSADQSPLRKIPVIGRFNLRHFISMGDSQHATLSILLVALTVSLLGHEFGFHPAVGAYMAGLILKEEYFLHQEKLYDRTRHIIDDVAFSWIGPVFFVVLGTKLIIDTEILVSVLPQTIILFFGLFFAQIISASLAARFTGHYSWEDSVMIGFGMLGRAELAFVVMDIAYVQNSILSTEAFYTLMFTAFWLNIAVPLTIRWWKPYYEGKKPLPPPLSR
ncbi:MAG: cation:proton antiporter [Candidatus Thiodiazotropha sp. (ex Dulcina madagascariensis)]|nr:cation:proton antiporter [Candidatus Thiodiazotropha sp. (ex Dulcina madagascariensis)]MCU7929147.1 cation:proton antiporter [Candidatus Thiodiazotropha sp. (ex Dulcina madagascariensis)]